MTEIKNNVVGVLVASVEHVPPLMLEGWPLKAFQLEKKGLKKVINPFKLLGLPPSAAVLEPHDHLSQLQSLLFYQLRLSLRLQKELNPRFRLS
ncbi:hypothetical protein ACFX14_003537 [Malus domestica]